MFHMKKTSTQEKKKQTEAKVRRCLMCGRDFESAWAGERVCKRCRSSHDWRHGMAGTGKPFGRAA